VADRAGALLDATRRNLPDMVRASVHVYNDDAEMDRLIAALKEIAG
jgi:selenocysteine lyase/cysteine desulfurase